MTCRVNQRVLIQEGKPAVVEPFRPSPVRPVALKPQADETDQEILKCGDSRQSQLQTFLSLMRQDKSGLLALFEGSLSFSIYGLPVLQNGRRI